MGKYQKIRETIKEIMQDGKGHTAEELHTECKNRGIEVGESRTDIYNIVYQLKKKGEIISDSKKGYILVERIDNGFLRDEKKGPVSINLNAGNKADRKLEFAGFEIVKPAIRKETKQIISVFANGDLALNNALCKILQTNKVEIHIKNDCSQIILVPDGNVLLEICKSNRIKNYIIREKLEKKKVKFPVYYVGEWDEENQFWKGDLVLTNPNRNSRKIVK